MKKCCIFMLIFLCLLSCTGVGVWAAGDESAERYGLQAQQPLDATEYTGTAAATLLYERNTKTLVFGTNLDASVNPTGLVKLLTALIVLEEGNPDEVVTVEQNALNTVPASAKKLGLKAGDQLTVRDLLYCMMVASANDAAAVAAVHIAGSVGAFVEKMNDRADDLGCNRTYFTDVAGLDDKNQYSTVREMAMIVEEALQNEEFAAMFGATSYELPQTVSCAKSIFTTNSLMDPSNKNYDSRITGGKPSKTSGRGSMVCTAEAAGESYLCLVMSTKETSNYTVTLREMKALLKLGFENYAVQQIFSCDQPFGMYAVENGENALVVGTSRDVYALLPKNYEPEALEFRDVKKASALQAPVKAQSVVGTLEIYYNDVPVATAQLLARHDVALHGSRIQSVRRSGGVFGKIVKWVVVTVLIAAAAGGAVLVVLRQRNIAKYRRKKAACREGGKDGLE